MLSFEAFACCLFGRQQRQRAQMVQHQTACDVPFVVQRAIEVEHHGLHVVGQQMIE